MLLLVFYYFISAFLFCGCSFNHLCVICWHFCFAMWLFQGHVACWNLQFLGASEEEQSLKERVPVHCFFSYWKGSTSGFLTALMFVRVINCSVSLNRGEGGYLATEETLFFEDQNGLHLLTCYTWLHLATLAFPAILFMKAFNTRLKFSCLCW